MINNKLDKVILLGASFKENTDDIRYSPTLKIYNNLIESDVDVSIYDEEFNFPNNVQKANSVVDNSLIVEMYPQELTYNKIKTEIEEMDNLIYFRFWDS